MVMQIQCPQCGEIDRVAKVSGIVSAGTSTSHYRGSVDLGGKVGTKSMTGSETTRTTLAAGLSPPAKPGVSVNLVIFTFFAGGLLWIFGVDRGVVGVVIALLGMAVLIGIWVLSSLKYKKSMERWKEDMKKWEEKWYCSRCDIVFIPKQQ